MKRLLILALLLLGCDSALGQTTTVTGTITDAQGNAYANGTASAIKVVSTGLSPGTPTTVPTSATGFFTFSGSTNALPSPASYQFTICATPVLLGQPTVNPTPKQICFTSGPIAISGASQDISTTLNAIAPTLGPQGQGTNPTFINPTVTGTLTVPAPSNCANSVATGLNTTLGANCTNSTGTGAWTVGGTLSATGGGSLGGIYSGNPTLSGNLTVSGTGTFSSLSGCQHVNANQTFAVALAAVSSPGCISIDPGTYTVSANATIPSGVVLYGGGGSILSIATATTLTINGPIFAPPGQLFAYVGTGTAVVAQGNVEATWFPGANLGVQVNNAALALNSAKVGNTKGAGKIHIAAGQYSVPLGVMNPQADVILSCDANQSTGITFTGVSGIAILFNIGPVGGAYTEWGSGIENCLIYGPGYPSGSGQAGTGIQLGDSTHGTIGVKLTNNFIAGFTLGMTWGANGNSWGTKLDHTVFTLNTQDFVYNPNAGGGTENVELDHVVFAPSYSAVVANDVVIGNGNTLTDMWFNNCSFDNAELVISNASAVGLNKPHFEYGFNTTLPFVSISNAGGAGSVTMYGAVVQFDPSSGSVPAEAILVANANLDLYGFKGVSNTASIPNYINATTSNVRVWGISQQTNIGGITSSGSRTLEFLNTTGSATWNLIAGNFTVNTTGQIQMQGPVTFTGNNTLLFSTTAPTIAAAGCGGSGASILSNNGTASFEIGTGTAPTAAGCTVTMPAAATSWTCDANTVSATSTTNYLVKQTGVISTTSVTIQNFSDTAVATAFGASDTIRVKCLAN